MKSTDLIKAFGRDHSGPETAEFALKLLGLNKFLNDGGPGSGNFGHKGRPGQVGGSGKGGGSHYKGGNKRMSAAQVRTKLVSSTGEFDEAKQRSQTHSDQGMFFGNYMDGVYYNAAHPENNAAVSSYNYHGDTLINGMLRGNTPRSMKQQDEWESNAEETRKHIETLEELAKDNKLRQAAVVFRGVETDEGLARMLNLNLPEGLTVEDVVKKDGFTDSLIGYTFCDPGFVSTSIDRDVPRKGGFDKACSLEIYLPKGTEGFYLGDAARITDEYEFLLQRGTQFVITDAYAEDRPFGKGKRLVLKAEVLSQQPQPIPELKKIYTRHPEMNGKSAKDNPMTDKELLGVFPGLHEEALKDLKSFKRGNAEDYWDRMALLDAEMFAGNISASDAGEIEAYFRGGDAPNLIDDFARHCRDVGAKAEPEFIAQAKKENPGFPEEVIRYIAGIKQEAFKDHESYEKRKEKDPDGYLTGVSKDSYERDKKQEKWLIRAYKRRKGEAA